MSMRTPDPAPLRPGHEVDDAIAYLIEIRQLASKKDAESIARRAALVKLIYENINRNARNKGQHSLLFLRILQSKKQNSKFAIEELIRNYADYKFDVLQSESSRPSSEGNGFLLPDCLIAAINRGDRSLINLEEDSKNPGRFYRWIITSYKRKDPNFNVNTFTDKAKSAWKVARLRQTDWGKRVDRLFVEFHKVAIRKTSQPANILHQLSTLEKTILSGLKGDSSELGGQKITEHDRKIMKENYFTIIAEGLEHLFKQHENQPAADEKAKDFYGILCVFAYLKAGNDKQAYEIKARLSQNAQNALNFMEQRQMEVIREKPSDELLRILKETYQFDVGIKHSVNIEAEYKARKEAEKAKAEKPWWRSFGVGGKSDVRKQQLAILEGVEKFTHEMTGHWKEHDVLLFKLGAMNYLAWQLAQEKRLLGPDSMIEPLILEQRDALIALIRTKGLQDNHLISSSASESFYDYWSSMVDSGISKPILSKAQSSVYKWKKLQVELIPEYKKQAETIRHHGKEEEEESLSPKTRAWLKINQDAWATLEKRQTSEAQLKIKAEKKPERPS